MSEPVEEIGYGRYLPPGTVVICSQGGIPYNLDALNALAIALAQAERERDAWQEDAKRYALNVDAARAEVERLKAGVEIEKAAHAACCENRLEILADLARVRAALEKIEYWGRADVANSSSDVKHRMWKEARAALEGL